MRRAIAVLLLVAGCTHGSATATPTPSGDECEREIKNARILTTVLDSKSGDVVKEFRAPDSARTDGLFDDSHLRLPYVSVPHKRFTANGVINVTISPPGHRPWTLRHGLPEAQLGSLIVMKSFDTGVYVAEVDTGRPVWSQQAFSREELSVRAVTGTDLLLLSSPQSEGEKPRLWRVAFGNGEPRWVQELPRADDVRAHGDDVLVLTSARGTHAHGELQTLDAATGRLRWKHRLPLPLAIDLAVDGDHYLADSSTIYFGGCE